MDLRMLVSEAWRSLVTDIGLYAVGASVVLFAGLALPISWARSEADVERAASILEEPRLRTVTIEVVADETISGPALAAVMRRFDSAEWSAATARATDFRNTSLGLTAPRVPVWEVTSTVFGDISDLTCGADVCLSHKAADRLGAIDGLVGLSPLLGGGATLSAIETSEVDESLSYTSVGGLRFSSAGAFSWERTGQLHLRTTDATSVRATSEVIAEMFSASASQDLRIRDNSQERMQLVRTLRVAEQRKASQALGVVLLTMLLMSVVSSLVVYLRRSDLGRRRVLGATRSAVVTLVIMRTVLATAPIGALAIGAGTAWARFSENVSPEWHLVAAWWICLLATAVIAVSPQALIAGRRDPILVVRHP